MLGIYLNILATAIMLVITYPSLTTGTAPPGLFYQPSATFY